MKQQFILGGMTTLCLSTLVFAQDQIDYTQPVAQRPVVTEDEGRFFRLGAWQLQPTAELSESFDSNIYATATREKDDFITKLIPTVKLQSDWAVHQVVLEAGADIGWYKDFSDENYQDYFIRNRNRFEIVRGNNLLTDVSYQRAHEARSSPDNVGASAEPITYDDLHGMLGFERSIGVVSLRADVSADDIKYDDTDRFGGGTIDNSYRDRTVVDGGIKLTYTREQTSQAYFSARVNDTSYDDSTVGGRPDRDNSGFDLAVGLEKNLSNLWIFNAYIGYSPRNFADGTMEDISGADALAFGAKVLWNPTALTSVIGNFDRRTYETTETDASALIHTALAFKVEHKMTESLLLDANLGYAFDDYAGSPREDDIYSAGLGASYFFTKLVSVRSAYNYYERNSSIASDDYDKHVASVQLRVNF